MGYWNRCISRMENVFSVTSSIRTTLEFDRNLSDRVGSSPWQNSRRINDRNCQNLVNLSMGTAKEYPSVPEFLDCGVLKCNLQRGGDFKVSREGIYARIGFCVGAGKLWVGFVGVWVEGGICSPPATLSKVI